MSRARPGARAGNRSEPRAQATDPNTVRAPVCALAPPVAASLAPWQRCSYARALAAFDGDRLAHGLLLCGPPRLGKRVVAEVLAQRLLCEAATPGSDACGRCKSCHLFAVRAQHDPPEIHADGSPVHPWGRPGHPDVLFVGHVFNDKASPPKMRSEIVIEQIREISDKLNLTPQYGRAVVVLIDPADAVNHAACNALLKTLEEPQPGRYLMLLTSEPARLPATIRSRCQRLEFRLPPVAEARDWLQAQGQAPDAVAEALEAACGNPGLAHDWLQDGGLILRREVTADLQRLALGRDHALTVAQRWTGDEKASPRLRFAADLALEQTVDGLASGDHDRHRIRRLAAWFDTANRTRDLLRTTVRADLAVTELLLAWCDAVSAHSGHKARR